MFARLRLELPKSWLALGWPWALSAGLIGVQFLPRLWLFTWLISAIILAICLMFVPRLKTWFTLALLVMLGASWGSFIGQKTLDNRLPDSLIKQDVWVVGTIQDLPQTRGKTLRFKFQINALYDQQKRVPFNSPIYLNWYNPPHPDLHIGETWRLKVRLKPAHGMLNPGGFDYEQWLFSQGIRVTGYVRDPSTATRLERPSAWQGVGVFRENIKHFIESQKLAMGGVLKALSIGERSDITSQQWQVFRDTGTAHLIAISGLHIGLVAGFAYLLAHFLWRHSLLISTLLPAQIIGQIASLLAAGTYAALAGFAIPTLRALLMLLAFLGLLALRRNPSKFFTLGFVLAIVLLVDPLAALGSGLWLSFTAVAAIALITHQGKQPSKHQTTPDDPDNQTHLSVFIRVSTRYLYQWTRIQWAVFVALLPLSLLFFGQFSLISMVANFIAIPVIGMLMVPLVLLALLCFAAGLTGASSLILKTANHIGELIWPLLSHFAGLPYSHWLAPAPSAWALILACFAAVILLAPKAGLWRGLAGLGFIPLFIPASTNLADGTFEVHVLDVGQGMAIMVQTHQHALIYDAGNKYSSGFDLGEAAVLPFMRQQGIKQLNTAIISHNNIDHYGGMASVLRNYPSAVRFSSAGFYDQSLPCVSGQSWQWDEVRFTFIHPKPNNPGSDNNDSCVLKITGHKNSALLTGDIERTTENLLLAHALPSLQSDVLIAPHHGSKSSSSMPFIQAVNPQIAIISAGYINRFGHPHPSTIKRYLKQNIRLFNTASSGEIGLRFDLSGVHVETYRQLKQRYWSAPLPSEL